MHRAIHADANVWAYHVDGDPHREDRRGELAEQEQGGSYEQPRQ
jgi:hypothetical protein